MAFFCGCCGEEHESLPEPTYQRPDAVWMYRRAGETRRIDDDDDHCVLRGRFPSDAARYFLRGVIPFRVTDAGADDDWAIGAWVEVAEADYTAYLGLAEGHSDGAAVPRFIGHIANDVLRLPDTLGAVASVQPSAADQRPSLWFPDDAEHLLARLQRDGIDLAQIHALVGEIH